MAQFEKHFTIAEARASLPGLHKRIKQIQDLLAQIRAGQTESGQKKLRILRGNGKGPVVSGLGPKISEVQKEIEQIAGMGIQIKDLERGLVDFPHFLGEDTSREVFLCYEVSEETIGFWHEIEDGFAGRRPL